MLWVQPSDKDCASCPLSGTSGHVSPESSTSAGSSSGSRRSGRPGRREKVIRCPFPWVDAHPNSNTQSRSSLGGGYFSGMADTSNGSGGSASMGESMAPTCSASSKATFK